MKWLAAFIILVLSGCVSNQPEPVDAAIKLQADYCETDSLTSQMILIALLDEHKAMTGDEDLCSLNVAEWMMDN